MKIANYLCEKYRNMIQNNEAIDLDEMATELEGLNLKDFCPELAEYLDKLNEGK